MKSIQHDKHTEVRRITGTDPRV